MGMRIKKSGGLLLLVIIAALIMVLPVAARSSKDQQKLVVVEGLYTLEADGTIHVGDYIIAPSDAFIPPDIANGDTVSVTGYLLPDGKTVQALSIEIAEAADTIDANTTPTSGAQTGDDTGSGTPDNNNGNGHGQGNGGQGNGGGNGHGRGQGNNNDDAQGNGGQGSGGGNGHGQSQGNSREHSFYCDHTDKHHPAAERIATEFGIDYTQVIALFCEGKYGFGEIVIAYRLANRSGKSVQTLLDLRDSGKGWGRIFHDLGIAPNEVMGKS